MCKRYVLIVPHSPVLTCVCVCMCMFCAGSESDKKSSVDQAFRDELLHLVVGDSVLFIISIVSHCCQAIFWKLFVQS